MSLLYKQRALR